ncbi:MAG: NAD(P)H-binding protein, partial [Anaerolineae bacterium]|nr:NAD(P)H-binding protein [Anaerolineae bacterium]
MTLLVTGASGNLGSRVIELLLETGAKGIIAGTRSPDKLQHLVEQGVELREVNFDDPAGLVQAFTGVDRLLLISTDAVDGTDKRLNQHKAA